MPRAARGSTLTTVGEPVSKVFTDSGMAKPIPMLRKSKERKRHQKSNAAPGKLNSLNHFSFLGFTKKVLHLIYFCGQYKFVKIKLNFSPIDSLFYFNPVYCIATDLLSFVCESFFYSFINHILNITYFCKM